MSHASSMDISNVVDELIVSRTLTPVETNIHEENQESQETEVESIVTIPSIFF